FIPREESPGEVRWLGKAERSRSSASNEDAHALGTLRPGAGYRTERAGAGGAGAAAGGGSCPQKMQRWDSGWWSLGQLGTLPSFLAMAAPSSIPINGPKTYSQKASQCPAPHAEPKLRAGFMLIPDTGASKVM